MKTKTISDLFLNSPREDEEHSLYDLFDELEYIQNPDIKSFVHAVLLYAEAFWVSPSTLDGSSHPPDEQGMGGLVLHTKRVLRTALILCNTHPCTQLERDYIVAAALLHDVSKAVFKSDSDQEILHDPLHAYTVQALSEWCGQQVASDSSTPNVFNIAESDREIIFRLIRCSHGLWSIVPETIPITPLEKILHTADLIATNLHIIVDGIEIKEERWM